MARGPIDERLAGDDDAQVVVPLFLRRRAATLAKSDCIPCRMNTIGGILAAGWVTAPSGMALLFDGKHGGWSVIT
jgi:hypothetical protein